MANTIERRILFMRRISMLLLFSTIVFWLTLMDIRDGESSTVVSLRTLSMLVHKPTIYAYSEKILLKENDDSFRLWDAAWKAAGFNTKLLTMEDARNHPEFKSYTANLGEIFNDEQLTGIKSRFYRYLAMSSSTNGGLLAEIDVLPLWPLSYNIKKSLVFDANSKFKVRCGSNHKPSGCLLSGSTHEWDRVAKEMVDSMRLRQDESSKLNKSGENKKKSNKNNDVPWDESNGIEELVSFYKGLPSAHQESQVLASEQANEMRSTLTFFRKSLCHTDKVAVRFGDMDIPTILAWLKQWNKDCVHKLTHQDLSVKY